MGFEKSHRHGVESTVLPEMVAKNLTKEKSVPLDVDRAVKVLSKKTGPDDNFQNDSLDSALVQVGIDDLADEFSDLLQMN